MDNVHTLGSVSPTALDKARVELHWLAQTIGAIGDAFIEHAPDDSHSNAAWSERHGALLGRAIGNGAQLGLDIENAELAVVAADGTASARIAARGKTLQELLSWSSEAIAAVSGASPTGAPTPRDYDLPEHAVADGARFSFPDRAALAELSRWYANATTWLTSAQRLDDRAGEVRCWPHHFDIGGIVMLEPDKPFEEARQLGFGWSPGDGSYDQPYFYITPFPAPETLPELAAGHWRTEGFTGAILPGTDVVASESQSDLVNQFFASTFERTVPLLEP